jgi:hypothetical protein
MSKFLPYAKVQQEQLMQTIRIVEGLKMGTYTRFRDENGRVGTIKTDRLERASQQLGTKLTAISQDEYEQILRAPKTEPTETTKTEPTNEPA